jgi:hypothetical protein
VVGFVERLEEESIAPAKSERMAASFIYISALVLWIVMACVMWCMAGLLFLVPRTRPTAWPMSLAVVATFPFVFAYQLLAAPIVLIVLLTAFALWRFLEPVSTITNPVVAGGFVTATAVSAVILFVASVAGVVDGWRTGWGLARGRPIKEMLLHALPKRYLNRLLTPRSH